MSLADRTPPTAGEYANYRKRFSNWGRWGDRDELGTLNHITPEARRAAAALVAEGKSVSLSRPIDTHAGPSNPFPAHHLIAVGDSGGLMDYLGLFVHGYANTHLDALCHIPTSDGRHYYNGSPVGHSNLPTTRTGTVEHWRNGIVARGVLYDVPRLRGADYVERGSPVHGWDLVDCAAAQGSEPRAGDAVLVRAGAGPYFAAHPGAHGVTGGPGLHASALEFLFETNAALLGWDLLDAATQDQGIPNPM
ncbi:MAG: cyclase family protein, partial [Deltaproteobacteria bacterium]|nr:cyclase family protein [Deltaproteobacteria bacterium]